jgi:hypothetical protein
MNETPEYNRQGRIRRGLLIWLASFTSIALVMGIALLATDNEPKKSPDILLSLLFGVVGASLSICLLGFVRWLRCWRNVRRLLLGSAIFATLIAIFYTEENWRGRRAWENCKRELEAKGAVLDWEKFIPPPVPDDQNFFTASTNILLRFHKAQTPEQRDAATQLAWLRFDPMDAVVVAEVTVLSSNSNAIPGDADLYLRYDHSVLTLGTSREYLAEPQSPFLPLFDLKDVPLISAIEQVAQVAKLNYTIDPNVKSADSNGAPIRVTIGWKNVTARQALHALLDNFDLVLVEDAKTGSARILPKKEQIYADAYATKEINRVLSPVLDPDTNGFQGARLKGALGIWLFAKSSPSIRPAQVVVWANQIPSVQEMSEIFSKNTAKSTGTNSFRICGNPRAMSAADYLAWSNQYEPAFDEIREALKRPYAILPGDYSRPYLIPIPNFVTMRFVAQTLAQRAQCDFLLNRPEPALREVTLMHDLCRILQKPPTGQPETLVEAMINVAIAGLYASTAAEGFRLKVWQEPQIVMLQAQFQATKLLPSVFAAFAAEQASSAHTLEMTPASEIAELFKLVDVASSKNKPGSWTTFWKKLGDPMYLFFRLAPRGWIYRNMVTAATDIRFRDGINLERETMSPSVYNQSIHDLDKSLQRLTPYNVWARIGIPNYLKAWETAAHNQTLANEGQIACALERYRLTNGTYPETLDALLPQFIEQLPHDIIGGQPLHYRRAEDGQFLLYSVGWNETDDGGTASDKMDQGDWGWQPPVK